VPQERISASKKFHLQFISLFFACKHFYKHGCADQKKTKHDGVGVDFSDHNHKRKCIRKNGAVKMRRDFQHAGKENKTKRQNKQRMQYRVQSEQAAECNSNPFTAPETIEQWENMTDYRSGYNERS